MKVITPGDLKIAKPWIGLRLECGRCHQVIELEEIDDLSSYWMPAIHKNDTPKISCLLCGNHMPVKGESCNN